MFKVLFFRTPAGNEPVREWIRELTPGERLTIGADLHTLQLGFPMGMPLCRPLGDGLYEQRTRLPTDQIARLLFFQAGTL